MNDQTQTPEERLAALGLRLPEPPAPAAGYIPARRVGETLYVSGQVAFVDGKLPITGKLGDTVTLEVGKQQAQVAALNALAVAAAHAGSLSALTVAQVMVFVASSPSFVEQHLVADGASNLLTRVLGEAGRHPRSAVATPCLPLDASVEVQVVFQLVSG